jgi:transposase-like protein
MRIRRIASPRLAQMYDEFVAETDRHVEFMDLERQRTQPGHFGKEAQETVRGPQEVLEDARYEKIREQGVIRSLAVLLAICIA